MRLICPGCAAQYEVQASAIPAEGRDVQCSNCGRTWFQRGPLPDGSLPRDDDDVILAAAAAATRSDAPIAPPETAPAEDTGQITADARMTGPALEGDEGGADAAAPADRPPPANATPAGQDEATATTPAAVPSPPPRKIDDAVLAVLREEAEREQRARRAEAGALESQPDLGLALQPQAAPRRPPDRIARISDPISGTDVGELRPRRPKARNQDMDDLAADELATTDEDTGPSVARRARLPDIEEINSTLRGAAERKDAAALPSEDTDDARQGRRGFRIGFLLSVSLGVIALLLYALAAPIAAAVPALEPVLGAYTLSVDSLRIRLAAAAEAAMRTMLAWIS